MVVKVVELGGGVQMNAEWQPIETAPRYFSAGQILTFRNYGGMEYSYPPARGKRGPWFQTSFWSETHGLLVGWPLNVQPTHWMPLPEPPTK
jgi:hypothetical protein